MSVLSCGMYQLIIRLASSNFYKRNAVSFLGLAMIVFAVSACGSEDSDNVDNNKVQFSSADVANPDLIIQEIEIGYCDVDGSLDDDPVNFTGRGYANSFNKKDAYIYWRVKVESDGEYNLYWRFANGGEGNRSAQLLINDVAVQSLDFQSTTEWSNWLDSAMLTVSLSKGENTIRLQAETDSGLANIDYIALYGRNIAPVDCYVDPESKELAWEPSGTVFTTSEKPTIWYASDSTVSHYVKNEKDQQGLGQRLPEFLTDDIRVANNAKRGRAVDTFKNEGLWQDILDNVTSGDVIFIEFGINDHRTVESIDSFKDYLREYIEDARAKGAVPVLVTPTPKNHYEFNIYRNAFTAYCNAKKEVAKELDVPLIDLQKSARAFLTELGPEKVTTDLMTDTLHYTSIGAYHLARLLAEGIASSPLEPLNSKILIDRLDKTLEPKEDGWNPGNGYTSIYLQ